jgi:hypothetical protein
MRLVGIINQLTTLGDPEPGDKVVLKYLRITRPRYKQLVLSIETLLDVSTLSIEEVTGRLKAVEDDVVESPAAEWRLLLINGVKGTRRRKPVMGLGVDPMAVVVAVVAAVGEVVAAVVTAMAIAHQAGRGIVIAVASRAIGLANVKASIPKRRKRRPIWPNKRSKVCCSLRLTPSSR